MKHEMLVIAKNAGVFFRLVVGEMVLVRISSTCGWYGGLQAPSCFEFHNACEQVGG